MVCGPLYHALQKWYERVYSNLKISWKSVVLANKVEKNSLYLVSVFNKTIIPLPLFGLLSPTRRCMPRSFNLPPHIQLALVELSPPQRPLCVVGRRLGRLGRNEKRARGARWEGGERREAFSLFPSSPARIPFLRLLLFIGIPSWSLWGGESSWNKCLVPDASNSRYLFLGHFFFIGNGSFIKIAGISSL